MLVYIDRYLATNPFIILSFEVKTLFQTSAESQISNQMFATNVSNGGCLTRLFAFSLFSSHNKDTSRA